VIAPTDLAAFLRPRSPGAYRAQPHPCAPDREKSRDHIEAAFLRLWSTTVLPFAALAAAWGLAL